MEITHAAQNVLAALSLVVTSGLVPALWHHSKKVDRMDFRLSALEASNEEKKVALHTIQENQGEVEQRLARVEQAIGQLTDLVPELRNLSNITAKMEGFCETSSRRLELIERKVFQIE